MRPRRMSDVARAVDGLLLGSDVEVTLGGDRLTRLRAPGALFVALPGEHTDGGRFVPEAFDNGAAGVLVRDGLTRRRAGGVRALDERCAAPARRRRTTAGCRPRVVGITGANGKTSTKDMTAAVLRARGCGRTPARSRSTTRSACR